MPEPLYPMDVALLEETRRANAIAFMSPASEPFAGGHLCRDAPGLWNNCAVGFGLDAPPKPGDMDRLIEFYEDAGIEPRAEFCPFALKEWLIAFRDAGFRPWLFEQIFARRLDPNENVETDSPYPDGIVMRQVTQDDIEGLRQCATIMMSGFRPEGFEGEWPSEDQIRSVVDATAIPGAMHFIAELDGEPVAATGMEVGDNIAALYGTTVLEAFRKRGVQQFLIKWRCEEAARRGARVASIGSRPRIPTERNVTRMGFHPAYTNVTLVRPRDGLKPVDE